MKLSLLALPLLVGAPLVAAQGYGDNFANSLRSNASGGCAELFISSDGNRLLNELQSNNNSPKTVLIPSNCNNPPGNVDNNRDQLTDLLLYHIISGNFSNDNVAQGPNHTIARSFLRDPNDVTLCGNRSQVVVLSRPEGGGNPVVIQPQGNVTTTGRTWDSQNVHFVETDGFLQIPNTVTQTATDVGQGAVNGLLQATGLADTLNNSPCLTLFAPQNVNPADLGGGNVQAIVRNHILNGTVVYSTDMANGTSFTTAGGEQLTTFSNSSGLFVQSGSATSRITTTDVIVRNGVVHLIDTPLINSNTNAAAASSAFESATSVAARQTNVEQGPVGASGAPGGPTTAAGGAMGMVPGFGMGSGVVIAWSAVVGFVGAGAFALLA